MLFFDNASTTKVDKDIMNDLAMINDKYYYNPGGLYEGGRDSRAQLEHCRWEMLYNMCAEEDYDLVYTGSATEANNLALRGFVKKNTRKILVSMGEHPSVYNTAMELKQQGYNVVFVNLNKSGCVDEDDFREKMTSDVDLISIMHVSNETGAINDISSLVNIAKSVNSKVVFHCDGVQAFGKLQYTLPDLGVDMYTISAHKLHGFKGVGALYVKKGIKLKPIIFGGGQEGGLRAGTENIMGIFSLSKAMFIAQGDWHKNYPHVEKLKEKFIELLSKTNLKFVIHSSGNCSPYVVSISFLGCRAETVLNMLNDIGIYVGNGSACSSRNSGNRILENMGVSKPEVESNIRISFSKYNTLEEVEELVQGLIKVVNQYLSKIV